ncbi:MAG: SDR family oxidoreductase [Polyangiaceae bacterium]
MTARPEAIERSFESIRLDEEVSFEVCVQATDIDAFAALSGDYNPRHMEASPPFANRIVHGAHLAAFFSRLVGMLLPGKHCIYLSQQTQFSRPAFPGDKLTVVGQVFNKDEEHRRLDIRTSVRRDGVILASGKAQVMILELPEEIRMSLEGKRAVVTGGSRGIGRATAEQLARAGAHVAISFRSRADEARGVVEQIQAAGGRALALPLDLGDRASVPKFFEQAAAELGGIDILVNNAAPPLARKSVVELAWENVARELELILGGALSCVQAALPHLVASPSGCIVNVLSSVVLGTPPPGMGSYAAAKSALAALTKSLAVELGPKKIRVNAVSPGLTDTEMTADIPQLMKSRFGSALPIGRSANADDVAAAIYCLCSDGARYLTGVNLPVTGGGWML